MFEFILPDLGEGVHEGEVLKWYVNEGDTIVEDAPLVDIETDKAAVTIPSPRGGKVAKLNGKVGEVVHVGNAIAVIDDGAAGGNGSAAAAPAKAASAPAPSAPAKPAAAAPTAPTKAAPAAATAPARSGPVVAAPATRKLARELGVDIKQIPGSGPAGRVTAEDVQRFAKGGVAPVSSGAPAGAGALSAPARQYVDSGGGEAIDFGGGGGVPLFSLETLPDFSKEGPVEVEALRSIRRKISIKMVTSALLVPRVGHTNRCDVTQLDEARKRLRERYKDLPGGRLTLLPFVIKAMLLLLKKYPKFNASLDPVKQEIYYKKYYNIGFAADTAKGLMVPNVKGADRMSVLEISANLMALAERARADKLDVSDMRQGTFTITNLGSLGGEGILPIPNYPELAILGLGAATDQPWVVDGQLAVRKIMPVSIAYDHRLIDGAEAARMMKELQGLLEEPLALLAEM